MQNWGRLFWIAAAALVPGIVLIVAAGVLRYPAHVPMSFHGAIIEHAARAQILTENLAGRTDSLNAPFAYNIEHMPSENLAVSVLSAAFGKITRSSGLAVMLAWVAQCMAASFSCFLCLRILCVPRHIAALCGWAFGMMPYAMVCNIEALDRSTWVAPFAVTSLVVVLADQWPKVRPDGRRVLMLGCAAAALLAYPEAWFSVTLLSAGAMLCLLSRKLQGLMLLGGLAIASGFLVFIKRMALGWHTLVPAGGRIPNRGMTMESLFALPYDGWLPSRLLEWNGHGFVQVNALPPGSFGVAAALGLGILAALFYALAVLRRRPREENAVLGTLVFALFALLLPAAVEGGIVQAFPEWLGAPPANRLLPFAAFAGLAGLGLGWTWAEARLRMRSRMTFPVARAAACIAVAAVSIWQADQSVAWDHTQRIAMAHYEELAPLLGEIAGEFDAGARIYQLPDRDYLRNPRGRVDPLSQARMYVMAPRLRWSYAPYGRDAHSAAWHDTVQSLPPHEMIDVLVLAGFDGLWFNRKDAAMSDQFIHPFIVHAGGAVLRAENDVHILLDLRERRQLLREAMLPADYEKMRQRALEDPAGALIMHESTRLPASYRRVAAWPFTRIDLLMDMEGGMHDLEPRGGALFSKPAAAPGVVGPGVRFDGRTVLVTRDRVLPAMLGGADFSFALWVRVEDFEDGSSLMGWHALGPPKRSVDLRLRKVAGQALPEFYLENSANPRGAGECAAVSDQPLELGQWRHLVGVRRAGDRLTVYVDGKQVAEAEDFGWNQAADVPLALSDQIRFTGEVDEVMVWDRALSEDTAYELYTGGRSALEQGNPQ